MPEASRSAVRRFLPLLWISIAALAAWIVFQRIENIDFEDVAEHLSNVPPATVIMALLCAAGVYGTIGLYEGIAVRLASARSTDSQQSKQG